jgi:hypothetical protein
MSYVVQPTGGFCNYLRVVFSYYKYAKSNNKHIIVIWEVTDSCNGYFLDYFKPVDGITFKPDNSEGLEVDYCGFSKCSKYDPDYGKLRLVDSINNKVAEKEQELAMYIAMHIRRTDHVELAKQHNRYIGNKDFFDFIDKHPNHNVYIATDNRKTQDEFIKTTRSRNIYTKM